MITEILTIPCNHRLIIMKKPLPETYNTFFWQICWDLFFLKSYCSSHCFISFPTQTVVVITVNTRFYMTKLNILVAMWIKPTNSQGFTSGMELFCVTRFCETITENYINETAWAPPSHNGMRSHVMVIARCCALFNTRPTTTASQAGDPWAYSVTVTLL